MLGDPDITELVDRETAEAYRVSPGENDVYAFEGGNSLTLNADENGVLRFVILR